MFNLLHNILGQSSNNAFLFKILCIYINLRIIFNLIVQLYFW